MSEQKWLIASVEKAGAPEVEKVQLPLLHPEKMHLSGHQEVEISQR